MDSGLKRKEEERKLGRLCRRGEFAVRKNLLD